MLRPLSLCTLCCFILSVAAPAWAQTLSSKKKKVKALYQEADKYRVRGRYDQAIETLEKAVKKDPKFIEAHFMLGVLYKQERNFERSNHALQAGLELTQKTSLAKARDFLLELGDNALRNGAYRQALQYLDQYLQEDVPHSQKTNMANRWRKNAIYALEYQRDWPMNRPRLLSPSINQFRLQYFPVLTADEQELIYTRRESEDRNADEDLVVSRKDAHGEWTAPVSLSKQINSIANEGTCSISADGRLLIFTSCTGREGFGSCDLFLSRKEGIQWSKPINMGAAINTEAWESQPSLSADGRMLYFTSDRYGGRGGRDIYLSRQDDNGQWTEAANLGQNINTPYDEISPFVHTNGQTLFFASNGRPGFGGYDIYKSEQVGVDWEEAQNFGSLINDYEDQFSLFITASGERAYYSYEKGDRHHSSQLVEVDIPEELRIKNRSYVVKGVARDKKTGAPMAARIELFDLKRRQLVSRVESDSVNGSYLVALTRGSDYALYAAAKGYLFSSLNFNFEASGPSSAQTQDIYLEPAAVGSLVQLSNVFFQLNQYDLDERSRVELDKAVKYLQGNPRIRIEIGGHTDNLGEDAYNKTLSLKRAQAVTDYLAAHGISRVRLAEKGYGASQAIAPNDSEEGRQKNRRIEFKITGL